MRVFLGVLVACLASKSNSWSVPTIRKRSVLVASADNGVKPSPSKEFNRRSFFQDSLVVGAGAAVTTTIGVEKANAATTPYDPPPHSMESKVVVITGGNTGLGLESSRRLAAAGATVILTSRNQEKGEQAVQAVRDYVADKGVTNDNISVLPLDLCDLDSVKKFPQRLSQKLGGKSVDILMNNAGVMAIPDRRMTKDGYEKTFQTNHLGHFLLTAKLMPMLSKSGARVINVSSSAWQFAGDGLELDNLNGEKEYGPWTSYGQSKLANILFTKELQKRADAAGLDLTALTLHPGAVQTDLGRFIVGEEKWESMKKNGMSLQDKLLFVPLLKFTKTVEDGASTQVFLAADQSKSVVGGNYYVDCKKQVLGGAPSDMDKAKELWSLSEKLTGVEFKI